MPAWAIRTTTLRPASKRTFSLPTRMRVVVAARLGSGRGPPVPNKTTFISAYSRRQKAGILAGSSRGVRAQHIAVAASRGNGQNVNRAPPDWMKEGAHLGDGSAGVSLGLAFPPGAIGKAADDGTDAARFPSSSPDGGATISDVRASARTWPSKLTSATSNSVRPEIPAGIFSLMTGSAYKGTA